jgi:hypothetical protein
MNNNLNKIPSIVSLHQEKSQKENTKNDMFTIVLNKCIEKIVYTNKHTDKTYIIFEVPKILIGFPNYDMKSCILFIISKLSQKGYMIDFIEPFYLYIDWGSNHSIATSNDGRDTFNLSNFGSSKQGTKILKKFPNSKVEFVYEDTLSSLPNLSKHSKKKKK